MKESDSVTCCRILAKNNAAVLQKEPSVVLLRGLLRWRGLVQRSLSLATDKVERILNILESQSKAIYDKK